MYPDGSLDARSNLYDLHCTHVARQRDCYIDQNHAGHLSTGMLGTNALVNVLPRHGAAEVMYRIATQTTFPSWGHKESGGSGTPARLTRQRRASAIW